ncbi:excalibur calcium-binding domain-containing protein [Cyanobium sp. Lug-B]|uniref:excalibur calcium-binding domain-containing protein n=1 Tax=Cyanobium sp. Lug-B TaxID=2823716 RepID=UPI0037C0714A|nr:excalibur calcium-binding domain-containing protein [Cyanobium sp. Lug-B]
MINTKVAIQVLLGALLVGSGTALAQNCSSFSNCAEAVRSYNEGNTKLDRDKDGIPCESICGSNGENMPR